MCGRSGGSTGSYPIVSVEVSDVQTACLPSPSLSLTSAPVIVFLDGMTRVHAQVRLTRSLWHGGVDVGRVRVT